MSKHVIDGPRPRTTSDRLGQFAKIDRKTSGKPGLQTSQLLRDIRTRDPARKLRRFAALDRRA